MNENDAYIFDVEEPREWVFNGEPVWISGWFVSKTGAVFSDVRAVIDGLPHLGILGMPRPEIEARHRGSAGRPHAGFLLRVSPPASARTLRIELLDAGYHWVEIWRTSLKVSRGGPAGGRYDPRLLPDHLHRLLQARRADPAADPAPLADQLVLEGAAVPLDTLPNPPFFGALEKPELVGGTQYGKIRVEGWIIHQEQRIVRLTGSTHPLAENEFAYGDLERKEAAALFPRHPHAARSQYFGMLDIDENAPGPAIIKLFAELEDGTRHLVFARRFHPRACQVWERPLPAFDRREFLQCVLALRGAAGRLGIQLGAPGTQWRALKAAYALYRREAPAVIPPDVSRQDPYAAWQAAGRLTPRLREALAAATRKLGADGPKFSILVDTRGCTSGQLAALAASLSAQIYPQWEAWFVGEAPPDGGDARCRFEKSSGPKAFVRALNAAAHQSGGTLLTLLPGHSRLAPDALLEIAERFAATPVLELELAYTDEDRMDDAGRRTDPDFKPEWSPALALSGLFPGHLSVVRRARFLELGSFREDFAAVPWLDLLLRIGDRLDPAHVAHIPLVCHHAWAGAPRELDPADPSYEQARRTLADAATRRGWAAQPFLPECGHQRRARFHQLRWSPALLAQLPVTIVIPTRDRLHLLQECVERLEETVDWSHVKLVIVDDHSRDPDALRYLAQIQKRSDLRCAVVRLPDAAAPFNYSRLVNAALPHLDTPLVLHLNNDVNALERGWLEEMAGWFTQPDVGVVGAKLIYPDRTLNHTGIVIGPHGGLADTPFARVDERSVGLAWHAAAREVSAVTGACLLTRTELYRRLGGFDENDFGVAYNDVDYCLRARAAGARVIYTPQAKLMHWGSATRGVTFDEAEHIAFVRRFPAYRDPYFSPHWRLDGAHVRSRDGGPDRTRRAGPPRLLLLTHNLNLEGAPLFLLEYATHLARTAGSRLEVLAAQDGPLRAPFEALGAHVAIADTGPLLHAADDDAFSRQLAELSGRVDWDQVDLVVCNTLFSFWGVHLARSADRPSLLYIHESSSVFRAFETRLALDLHHLVHDALRTATRALFLCAATRAYYADDDRGNFRIVPSWIRLGDIDEFRRTHERAALRCQHGFRDDEVVIANIGTVCERKGQHIFLRAADHFNREQRGGPPVRFLLVGARPGIYLDLLQRDIARLGLTNLTLVPETREVFDFFVAADMFVCTSYEESFPRVVMEAMAFRTPIVSTDVHGIADMIGQRQDGYLVKPGDVAGLALMMRTCLAKERSGKSLAPAAYSKALRLYDATHVLPWHERLAREAVLAHE
ncbi:glycosyltransferase [Opitutus sp. GAS368]|uniref:glycosyltransferase n=1 Tax=Opitutus sp. GAS368 TaxID=1882749 RepID=UPI00087C92AE|nr:glycosyltransferase [Opitutus sp. GAS368]SDS25451.1 Glycosyltransferase, GT2 family [Opitutus sp. GAS368]